MRLGSSLSVAVALLMIAGGASQGHAQDRIRLQDRGLVLEGVGSYIGVSIRDATPEEVRTSQTTGVMVEDVRQDSPAARGGLRKGDVIVDFDGERARSARQFTRLVRETVPGRAVAVTVMREGSRQTLQVTPERRGVDEVLRLPELADGLRRGLRSLPDTFSFEFDGLLDGRISQQGRLGIQVTPLSGQLAAYFGVTDGVLVSQVTQDSPAASAGFRAGDVIIAVDGETVSSPADVARAVREAGPGAQLSIRVMRDRSELTLTPTLPENRRRLERPLRPVDVRPI